MARKTPRTAETAAEKRKRTKDKSKRAAASSGSPLFTLPPVQPGPDAPVPVGARGARVIVYVHGIGNKPAQDILKCQWDTALFGHPMGDRTRLAYWVNRDYYPTVEEATCASPDRVRVDDDEVTTHAIMALARGESPDDDEVIAREVEALADKPATRKKLAAIALRLRRASERQVAAPGRYGGRIVPIPFLRRLITPRLTRAFLRDVYDFLYVEKRRRAMEQSLIDRLGAGGGPFVVIGHSQGSLIAYDVLRQLDKSQFDVPLFLTIGSPLGLDEVQDELKDWAGGTLAFPPCVRRWVNICDPHDIVAADKRLNGEFAHGEIHDIQAQNADPDNPHSGTGYLQLAPARQAVRQEVGAAFGQVVAPFVVAGDLIRRIENGHSEERHQVLVQLASETKAAALDQSLDQTAESVETKIHQMLTRQGIETGAAKVERLRRYVVAELTRLEIETLRSHFQDLRIDGIWRDAEKRAFIHASTHTVQARPANLGYGADGHQIGWAVLDTGIRADHPHFSRYENVVAQWDCTQNGRPVRLRPGDPHFDDLDENGHGTHVAGIIAGSRMVLDPRNGEPMLFSGMAPRCRLFGFKVLDENGNGRDSWIIKALDSVAEMNERAGKLVIHGLNLSLGGSFDPSVFGCGHTPLCQELRRLWGQGVLVCLAAGNEGYAALQGEHGIIQANLDITIGDPANLDEAIAVGSVHKTNPHTYGISYFSSRGPTADGRYKPDLVAPGERIISARHDWRGFQAAAAPIGPEAVLPRDDFYVEMSGTSMATPHVSGVLASFLSLRREFISYPDRVKKILLDSCVDIGRDRYMQGAGLPNLIKMLALH